LLFWLLCFRFGFSVRLCLAVRIELSMGENLGDIATGPVTQQKPPRNVILVSKTDRGVIPGPVF
jgi:hypothetical protein